jgi:hypothetical protein
MDRDFGTRGERGERDIVIVAIGRVSAMTTDGGIGVRVAGTTTTRDWIGCCMRDPRGARDR